MIFFKRIYLKNINLIILAYKALRTLSVHDTRPTISALKSPTGSKKKFTKRNFLKDLFKRIR